MIKKKRRLRDPQPPKGGFANLLKGNFSRLSPTRPSPSHRGGRGESSVAKIIIKITNAMFSFKKIAI